MKNAIIIFRHNTEAYKKIICDTPAALRNEIEEQLYILWELTPLHDRRWWRDLEQFGTTTYTYHNTTVDTVNLTREGNTITVSVIFDGE